MKKTLISVDNLDQHICGAYGKVYVCADTILTPGAKDELSKRGVGVVYGPRPDGEACLGGATRPGSGSCPSSCAANGGGTDADVDVLVGVAAVLQKEYGVTDPEMLKSMSLQVVRALKDSI